MSLLARNTTISTKDRESQDALSSPTGLGTAETVPRQGINVDPSSVTKLGSVNNETLTKFSNLRESLAMEIQQQFASGKFPPGIYNEDGKTYYVIPDSLASEDNIIGAMICDLASFAGCEVKLLDRYSVKYTTAYDKRFVTGLWFGMFSSTHLKRRRAKQSYEMGRTCSFALLVKNVFERDKNLGPKALVKDNFFFGNNPSEVTPKGKIAFYLKTKLLSFFEDTEIGNLVYGILNHAASRIGFTHLLDDERDLAISDNLIPVDQLITSCYPTVTTRRGRQMTQQSRKPNPIRSSPLFLKEEMNLISSLTSLIFTDLGAFTKDYQFSVYTHGFSFVQSEIRRIINVRLETLQRFAHVTKERLQAIRKVSGKTSVRKAGVLREDVLSLLRSTADPARKLVQELKHIIGAASFRGCYAYAYKRVPQNIPEFERLVYIKALDLYTDIQEIDFTGASKYPKDIEEPLAIDFENGIKSLRDIEQKCGNFSKNLKNISRIQSFKIFGRTEQIKGLKSNITSCIRSFMQLPKITRDICVNMYFEGHYRDSSGYFNATREYLNELQELALKTLVLRVIEEKSDNVKRVIESLQEILRDTAIEGSIDQDIGG